MADGIFRKLMSSLTKSRNSLSQNLDNVFTDDAAVDEDFYEELEERLIMADIGVVATSRIMDRRSLDISFLCSSSCAARIAASSWAGVKE